MRANPIPQDTPRISVIQSLTSALRLKEGCSTSIMPPKMLAPMKTGSNPNRPVRDNGKARTVNAIKCTTLSTQKGVSVGLPSGQSIIISKNRLIIAVAGISRYLRTSIL